MKNALLWLAFVFPILLFFGCSKENPNPFEEQPPPQGKAKLTVSLTDAPATYEAVNIEILSIGALIDGNWYDFDIMNPGVYDLLELSNGNTALLLENQEIPAGMLTEMKMTLGNYNFVIVDGQEVELKIPSGQSSGYKIKINQLINEGFTYQFVVDFNAEKSIVATGNGGFQLKPVVDAFLDSGIGSVSGKINPVNGGYYARLYNETHDIGSYIVNGQFQIVAVPEGTYHFEILPSEGYALYETGESIDIVAQVNENLGTVTMVTIAK